MVSCTVPLASHDQKGHLLPHFDHLDIRNSVMPLTMPSASHVAHANASGLK